MASRKTLYVRLGVAVVALSALAGCTLPPALVIASYALDVGSYIATGKTTTDHGISLIAQRDCAVMRIFEGSLCAPEEEDYQLADAGVLEPLAPDGPTAISPLAPGGDLSALPALPARGPVGPGQVAAAGLLPPPLPVSPLAAGGDLSRLPAIALLPDARYLGDDRQLVEMTLTRAGLLRGAAYLADGMLLPNAGDNS